jgi:hypothetical protein
VNALQGNTYLQRLELWWIHDFGQRHCRQALAAALLENKGLAHLAFCDCKMDDWNKLLEAIYLHPSLRSLDLPRWGRSDAKEKRDFTKAVADMLTVNKRIEVISFHEKTFDEDDWNKNVSPRLERNLYRMRFPSYQKIEEASTRAAVLARALAKFASKPHLVLMLLNQNHDIVSSYLDYANDLHPIPPRKCSHSPSLDGMSAAH